MNGSLDYKKVFLVIALSAGVLLSAYAYGVLGKNTSSPAVVVGTKEEGTSTTSNPKTEQGKQPDFLHYIEIIQGCGPYYDTGTCVNMRTGPSTSFPVIQRLRTGVVLKVEGETTDGERSWYKVIFDGEIRYPERVSGDWYVAVDPTSVLPLHNIGDEVLTEESASTTKRIIVDVSSQMLFAYDGEKLFMEEPISTGLEFTPTPRGTFTVFKKTPSRYMQGPLPGISDQAYDLPGVPWDLYFTKDGAVIHGAYWHDHFGKLWSHGCVNLSPENAKKLYLWADIGTKIIVQN